MPQFCQCLTGIYTMPFVTQLLSPEAVRKLYWMYMSSNWNLPFYFVLFHSVLVWSILNGHLWQFHSLLFPQTVQSSHQLLTEKQKDFPPSSSLLHWMFTPRHWCSQFCPWWWLVNKALVFNLVSQALTSCFFSWVEERSERVAGWSSSNQPKSNPTITVSKSRLELIFPTVLLLWMSCLQLFLDLWQTVKQVTW